MVLGLTVDWTEVDVKGSVVGLWVDGVTTIVVVLGKGVV